MRSWDKKRNFYIFLKRRFQHESTFLTDTVFEIDLSDEKKLYNQVKMYFGFYYNFRYSLFRKTWKVSFIWTQPYNEIDKKLFEPLDWISNSDSAKKYFRLIPVVGNLRQFFQMKTESSGLLRAMHLLTTRLLSGLI